MDDDEIRRLSRIGMGRDLDASDYLRMRFALRLRALEYPRREVRDYLAFGDLSDRAMVMATARRAPAPD